MTIGNDGMANLHDRGRGFEILDVTLQYEIWYNDVDRENHILEAELSG